MMRRLHRKVNIVVVIAKADSLTAAEIKRLKTRILNDLDEHQIQVSKIEGRRRLLSHGHKITLYSFIITSKRYLQRKTALQSSRH